MNLRKRKATDSLGNNTDNVENTAPSLLPKDKRVLNSTLRSNKQIKLEKTTVVLNETIKSEADRNVTVVCKEDSSNWEKVVGKANKGDDTKVSDKFMFK